ncbi:MAG TPA: Crp/Fnr family transcriptional regulator [Bacteroidales bacterium]|nr:Crp/Fnr family transcriptional regulator [Bacteroidales bacterium]HPT01806.1 Crp/Fnr family transcriptional regulator [Bacteroidales bacterium]
MKKISSQFISPQDFDRIDTACIKLRFKKGETILKQGNIPSHIVFLEKGLVKFNFEDESGKNIILTVVSAPRILGGANLFYKDNNLFSIIAVEECEAVLINSNVLLSVMSKNARFSIALFQIACQMFKSSIMNFISLASKQKEGRIADIILFLVNEVYHRNEFNLSFTRKELAEFAGCSAENLIMTLSKWQNEGVIQITGRQLEILDMERLNLISKIG